MRRGQGRVKAAVRHPRRAAARHAATTRRVPSAPRAFLGAPPTFSTVTRAAARPPQPARHGDGPWRCAGAAGAARAGPGAADRGGDAISGAAGALPAPNRWAPRGRGLWRHNAGPRGGLPAHTRRATTPAGEFEAEREELLRAVARCGVAADALHAAEWEARKRGDEVRELQQVRRRRRGGGRGLVGARGRGGAPVDFPAGHAARPRARRRRARSTMRAARRTQRARGPTPAARPRPPTPQALSDAQQFLFEERQRLLALQAENDELKLQVGAGPLGPGGGRAWGGVLGGAAATGASRLPAALTNGGAQTWRAHPRSPHPPRPRRSRRSWRTAAACSTCCQWRAPSSRRSPTAQTAARPRSPATTRRAARGPAAAA
jgi:hypothetical protein